MFTKSDLRLLHRPGHAPGADGFKLIGKAKEGYGSCKIWLRKNEPWERYLDPRVRSEHWDIRYYVHFDSAFALQTEFTIANLNEISDSYEFVQRPQGLDSLELNGDPVHDAVLEWAWEATGFTDAPQDAAAEPTDSDTEAEAGEEDEGDSEDDEGALAGEVETEEEPPTSKSADTALLQDSLPTDDGWQEAEQLARRISGEFEAVPPSNDDQSP